MMTQPIDTTLQSLVDTQLMEQGAFTSLELLLTSGRLVYTDYERWRRGDLEFLDEAFLGSPKRIRAQVESAVAYAKKIGLVEEAQTFNSWQAGGQDQVLKLSADDSLHQLLGLRLVSQQDLPQLDMFFDNPVVVLVNGIAGALARRTLDEAEAYLDQLYQQAPNNADLPAFDQLVDTLRRAGEPVADAVQELQALQQLAPHAKRLLSAQCRDYLVPLWRRLAAALEEQRFNPDAPNLHNSYVLAQAQDWAGVSEAIVKETEWWQSSVLCQRLAVCGYRRQERAESLTAWAYLCWQYPEQAADLLDSGKWPDLNIVQLWHKFLETEDELELETPFETQEFPAWLLINEPGLCRSLPRDLPWGRSSAEALYNLVHQLLMARLEGNGEQELELRKAVQASQPALFLCVKQSLR